MAWLIGCSGAFPADPEATTDRVASARVVKVGVTENPPWIERRADEPSGVEADIVRGFARTQNARIEWVWGQQEALFAALEHFELDLMVGGIDAATPWSDRVGLTRPWHQRERHRAPPDASGELVLAVPPGENRWLTELERFLAREKPAFQRRAAELSR